jgi:hypothetical protein
MFVALNPIGLPQPSTSRTIDCTGLSCGGVCPM